MSHGNVKLEVCVDSIASAIAAHEGGASRIELCSALTEGGLTPTPGILKTLKEDASINIPIFCMLRPRRGNDFIYSDLEMNAITSNLRVLKEIGADGFVFGALTKERKIHHEQCQRIIEEAGNLPVTFHRAFDLTNPTEMHINVKRIIEMGFKRILSSGFRATAAEGIDFLTELIARHHNKVTVMPGAGINVDNLEEILTVTKCAEFHASAKSEADAVDKTKMECDITMGKQDITPYSTTDVNVVIKMVNIARAMSEK